MSIVVSKNKITFAANAAIISLYAETGMSYASSFLDMSERSDTAELGSTEHLVRPPQVMGDLHMCLLERPIYQFI